MTSTKVPATVGSAGPATAGTTPDLPSERAPHWFREVVIAAVFYLVYSVVRNTFGASAASRSIAFRHARGVIKVQDSLGLWFEPTLQEWYLNLPAHGFIRAWNVFYGTAHFVVTIGVLVYAFLRAPHIYRFARNLIAGATALALIGFATYTLMPPRLLDSTSEYGGCYNRGVDCNGYGIVDTIEQWGGLWRFSQGTMSSVSNQLAAMPSLHFGWSMWCAIIVVMAVGSGRKRWLAFLYPLITLFCILVTGNHYWLDAFFGGVALLGGWVIATWIDRWSRSRAARRTSTDEAVINLTDSNRETTAPPPL